MPAKVSGAYTSSGERNPLALLDGIPEDDPATSELVEHGRTIGCFQIESPGMRATLKEIHARTIEDILAALALYRPGPLTGGLKDAFVPRYRGQEPAVYLHPALEPLLGDTYGVILYQEQVLRIAHELAGLSLADADLLRRAMSHFDPGKQMQTLKERFLAGAAERNGVPEPHGGAHLGADGGLRRVWLSQGACRLLRPGGLAVGLVQDPLPGPVHGGGAGQLGRVLRAAGLPDRSAPAGAGDPGAACQPRPARVQRALSSTAGRCCSWG